MSKLLYSWLFNGPSEHHFTTQTSTFNHFLNGASTMLNNVFNQTTVRAPVFGRHQFFGTSEHYGKAHGSLLSGWMNYIYTACCLFPTSSNILILPSQFWQIRFESCWLHCSKCRILVLLRYLRTLPLAVLQYASEVNISEMKPASVSFELFFTEASSKRPMWSLNFMGFVVVDFYLFVCFSCSDLIGYLLFTPDLCTPAEFLNRYDQPMDVVLDNGKLWLICQLFKS